MFANGRQYEMVAMHELKNLVIAYRQLFYIAC